MNYFNNRPQICSKPTKEELAELSTRLSSLPALELCNILLSIASESFDATKLIATAIQNLNYTSFEHLHQPVQQPQLQSSSIPTKLDNGLLTPIDISEDSEMSGTECSRPSRQNQSTKRFTFSQSSSPAFNLAIPSHSSLTSRKVSNKRKALIDRDENIPTSQPPTLLLKKRKSSDHSCTPQNAEQHAHPHPGKDRCLNCGLWVPHDRFDDLHGCIYHPGSYDNEQWSCCKLHGLNARGCLTARHRDLNKDGWRIGLATSQQRPLHAGSGPNPTDGRSHYAHLVSIGLI